MNEFENTKEQGRSTQDLFAEMFMKESQRNQDNR